MLQQRTANGQLFPSPAPGSLVEETPPVFAFLPEEGVSLYRVEVRNAAGKIVYEGETDRNFLVPEDVLPPGQYAWDLICGEERRGWWNFEISSQAVVFRRPTAEMVFASVPEVRPRHLFFAADKEKILKDKQPELAVLRRNIALALEQPLPQPPVYHHDGGKPEYREYFGRYRDYCDRDLVACALGHALLDDENATRKAKELLLTICDWNPAGPCSLIYPWNDEIGLSNARCLPAVYDLLWDILTEQQRYVVEQTIAAYAEQCRERLIRLNFTANPGNSHAGRIPAYLGEAALVLKGSSWFKEETLKEWLSLALDIYGGIFPFYGTSDGGWAEGPFYASSYTRWYLPFFMAVERFSGVRFLDRPFYQRVIHFFLHFAPPERENHPFCDGYWCSSEDPEWPGFFAQNPFRLYGERFGPDLAREWAKRYNTPEIYKLHLLDLFIPAGHGPENGSLTGEASPMAVFEQAGFASCQTNLADQTHNTALLVRASKFGSVSHQHADQGSFALIRNNKTLISPSGYFGRAYGTRHHQEWTNATVAHNCILVDGKGQERNSFRAAGHFTHWDHRDNQWFTVEADLSEAYPMLNSYHRRFILTESELVIEDRIESSAPHEISWLLHTLSEPVVQPDGSVLLEHGGERAVICPDPQFAKEISITNQFGVAVNEGVPEEVQVSMPDQYHLTFTAHLPASAALRVVIQLG